MTHDSIVQFTNGLPEWLIGPLIIVWWICFWKPMTAVFKALGPSFIQVYRVITDVEFRKSQPRLDARTRILSIMILFIAVYGGMIAVCIFSKATEIYGLVAGAVPAMLFIAGYMFFQKMMTPRFLKYDTASATMMILLMGFLAFWMWSHFLQQPYGGKGNTHPHVEHDGEGASNAFDAIRREGRLPGVRSGDDPVEISMTPILEGNAYPPYRDPVKVIVSPLKRAFVFSYVIARKSDNTAWRLIRAWSVEHRWDSEGDTTMTMDLLRPGEWISASDTALAAVSSRWSVQDRLKEKASIYRDWLAVRIPPVGKLLQSPKCTLISDVYFRMPANVPCFNLKVFHPFGDGNFMLLGEFQINSDTSLNPAGFDVDGSWHGYWFWALNIAEPQIVVESGNTRRQYKGIPLEEDVYFRAVEELLNRRPMDQLIEDIKSGGRLLSPGILDPDEFNPVGDSWFRKFLREVFG